MLLLLKFCNIHVHVHVILVIETRPRKATMTDTDILARVSCLRRDLNPQYTAYHADGLPTELLGQLSWAGRIFNGYGRAKASLL